MTSAWLDTDLTVEERVEALLSVLTLEERVGQLHMPANLDPTEATDRALIRSGGVGSTLLASGATAGNVRDDGIARDHIHALHHVAATSRLAIPLLVGRDVIHGHRTVFPIPLGLAASFDEDLVARVFERAAAEAAADGIGWTFAPMIDVVDDARWGRVAESFGESPLLTARLGAAAVRGIQSSGIAACAKHFVGYGMSRGGRDYAGVDVGPVALRGRLLPPFRAAVEAGTLSVMAAFSAVDGIPMHSHRALVRGVLKEEWGFDGVVVADWGAVGELVAHGVARDLRHAARLAIECGIDIDMASGAYSAHLADLVRDGVVDPELVTDAARRVLRMKMRLGLFDPDCPLLPGATPAALGLDRRLAHEAAATALVVLKGSLPLDRAAAPVLVTGPYAHERASLLGTWVLDGDPGDVPTIAEAVSARCAEHGLPVPHIDDGAFADRTLRLAREAGTVVAVVGEHAIRSGEDSAVGDLGLPPGQLEVIRALRAVSHRLVVVVIAGRPLALTEVAALADVLVLAWHPGTEGATALAALLFGTPPSTGRLPMSLPRSVGHLPLGAFETPSGRPLPVDGRGLTRYADGPGSPFKPFGAGRGVLACEDLSAPSRVAIGETVLLRVRVANDSDHAVRESLVLMMRSDVAEVTRPTQEVADVAIVGLAAGQSGTVRFAVPPAVLGYHGRDGRFRLDVGRVRFWVDGSPEAAVEVDLVDAAG